MAPIQVLTNNLLYDFSQVPIPDRRGGRGASRAAAALEYRMRSRGSFSSSGPISSIFDYTTFFVMLWVFNCWDPARASVFQTGWFVESLMTQTLIIHVIRTNKIPFMQSRASWPLTVTTLSIMAFGIVAAVFPTGPVAGPHAPAADVLADPYGDTAWLCGAYANDQNLAAAEEIDLNADFTRDKLLAALAFNSG